MFNANHEISTSFIILQFRKKNTTLTKRTSRHAADERGKGFTVPPVHLALDGVGVNPVDDDEVNPDDMVPTYRRRFNAGNP
jgi:hypothetical protein